jgi:hypothetical protein
MEQQHFCQDCHQKDDCQEIYRRLGGSKCPPVFLKVIVAFLLPMVIFIISIAIFDRILTGSGWSFLHSSQSLQTVATFFMALITTVVFILFEKLLEKIIRS